jgi:hypothetical protein
MCLFFGIQMVKIAQITSCQVSCADGAGGGNSSDWNEKENPLAISLLSSWRRLLRGRGRTPVFSTAVGHALGC